MIIFVTNYQPVKKKEPKFEKTAQYKKLLEHIYKKGLALSEVMLVHTSTVKEYDFGGCYYVDSSVYMDIDHKYDTLVALDKESKMYLDGLGVKSKLLKLG